MIENSKNNGQIQNAKNKEETIEKGIQMFIFKDAEYNQHEKPENLFYYYEKIPNKFLVDINSSTNLLNFRNVILTLINLEIFYSIIRFFYYLFHLKIFLMIITILIGILSLIGFYSIVNLHEFGLIFYSLVTITFPGAFFLYQAYEYLIFINRTIDDENKALLLNEPTILFVIDLICGSSGLYFLSLISSYLQNEKDKVTEDDKDSLIVKDDYSEMTLIEEYNKRSKETEIELLCIICLEKKRNVSCYPCKDILICENCLFKIEKSFSNRKLVCPKCRIEIESFKENKEFNI